MTEIQLERLDEIIEQLTDHQNGGGCSFFACEGPDVEPESMITCRGCWAVHDLKELRKEWSY